MKFFFKVSHKKLIKFTKKIINKNLNDVFNFKATIKTPLLFDLKIKLRKLINQSKCNTEVSNFCIKNINLQNKKILKRKQFRAKGRLFDIHKKNSTLSLMIMENKPANYQFLKNKNYLIYSNLYGK